MTQLQNSSIGHSSKNQKIDDQFPLESEGLSQTNPANYTWHFHPKSLQKQLNLPQIPFQFWATLFTHPNQDRVYFSLINYCRFRFEIGFGAFQVARSISSNFKPHPKNQIKKFNIPIIHRKTSHISQVTLISFSFQGSRETNEKKL